MYLMIETHWSAFRFPNNDNMKDRLDSAYLDGENV
jgi:hypothetical protein